MHRKLFVSLSLVAILSLMAPVAYAINVRLSGPVDFALGTTGGAEAPLTREGVDTVISRGHLAGLETQDVLVRLETYGPADVECSEGSQVVSTHTAQAMGIGSQRLKHEDYVHGRSPFQVETTQIWLIGDSGCSPDETAEIVFVYWDTAELLVKDPYTHAVLLEQDFECLTMPWCIKCRPEGE